MTGHGCGAVLMAWRSCCCWRLINAACCILWCPYVPLLHANMYIASYQHTAVYYRVYYPCSVTPALSHPCSVIPALSHPWSVIPALSQPSQVVGGAAAVQQRVQQPRVAAQEVIDLCD